MIKKEKKKVIHDLLDNITAQVQYHLITKENRNKGISNKLKLTKPNSIRQKHHFGPYILESQSIQTLHFESNQFGSCYFQITINLIPTVKWLTESTKVANGMHT